jgi:hypothetical protein
MNFDFFGSNTGQRLTLQPRLELIASLAPRKAPARLWSDVR